MPTTVTIEATVNSPYSVSSTNATYLTARAGSNLSTTTQGVAENSLNVIPEYQILEAFFTFDTSSLTVAYSPIFSLYLNSMTSDPPAKVAEIRLSDYGSAVETTDFVAGADVGSLPFLASLASGLATVSQFNDFVDQGAMSFINLGGSTKILIHTDRFRLASVPTGFESFEFRTPSQFGGVSKPKLTVITAPDTASGSILYPNFDIVTNTWTTDTGATTNLYTAIDEVSPSDTDYVQSPTAATSSQYYETFLEGHSDPLSSSGHIVHYRYQKNVSGGNTDLTVELRQGRGNVLTLAESNFESGLSDWAATGNNTAASSTAQAHMGLKSAETTGNAGGTSRLSLPNGTGGRPVRPSTTYTISAWFRTAATARTVGVDVRWYDSSGGFLSTSNGPTTTDSSSAWTQVTGNVTSHASAAFAAVECYISGTINTEVHYIDDVSLSGAIASWSHTNISNSWTTQNQTLSSAQADFITNYSDLQLRFIPSFVSSDKVPTLVADRATANSNSAVTTVDLVLASMTVGNYLIIRSAADNSGGGGAARSFTLSNQSGTPIDTGTIQTFQQNNDPGVASAGTTCNVGIAKISATSGTVRITYGGSVVQSCVAEEWSNIDATTPVVGTPVGANSTASTNLASMTDTSVALGNLAYGVEAVEGPSSDTYTQDGDSTAGTWSNLTQIGTSNATDTDNQTTYGGYKVVTATGAQTYNPTINNARDSAGLILELAAAAPTIRDQVSWANFELPAPTQSAFYGGAQVAGAWVATATVYGAGDV